MVQKSKIMLQGCSMLAVCWSHSAVAQQASNVPIEESGGYSSQSDDIPDIVVTAQKRSQSLQKVPIAATALTAEMLTKSGVNTLGDLTKLSPNLSFASTFGNSNPQITIRGVGSSSFNVNTETTVAVYLDEFVLNSQFSKLGQMFDLERVEVLRGPQGTLYGKNSTGGAINFVSRKPDGTSELNGTASVGRYGEYIIELGGQLPISEALSARVAIKRRARDGYGFNTVTGRTINDIGDWAGRLSLRYDVDGLDATLKFFGDRSRRQANYPYPGAIETPGMAFPGRPIPNNTNALTGFTPSPDIDITSGDAGYSNIDARGVTLNVAKSLGDLTLTSVTGYMFSAAKIKSEVDSSPIHLASYLTDSDVKQVSQELRLSSGSDRALSWIIGASFFQQKIDYFLENDFGFFGIPSAAYTGDEKQTSLAAFVDGTYEISDQLNVVAGVRITKDRKKFAEHSVTVSLIGPYGFADSEKWVEPTYRLGVNFQATNSTLLYASYNHGYRSGAFDAGLKTSTTQFVAAGPEFVDNFEVGAKSTLLNGHLRFSGALFYQKFKDQQNIVANSAGVCCAVVNVGKAEIYGGEIEGIARISNNFDITFSGAVTRSKYLDFQSFNTNYAGSSLQNVPRYQARIAPEVRYPMSAGELFFAPDIVFTGKSRLNSVPDPYELDVQKPYEIVNGQAGYRAADGSFSIFAFVKNATGTRYRTFFTAVSVYGLTFNVYSEPTVYGLTTSFRF